tara:strand:+ start:118 stop:324 length:207 start_codon:yes stop_codon:yes gene_type:complete
MSQMSTFYFDELIVETHISYGLNYPSKIKKTRTKDIIQNNILVKKQRQLLKRVTNKIKRTRLNKYMDF